MYIHNNYQSHPERYQLKIQHVTLPERNENIRKYGVILKEISFIHTLVDTLYMQHKLSFDSYLNFNMLYFPKL